MVEFKFDKFSIVMIGAVLLAIGMLAYNPIQQYQILQSINDKVITTQQQGLTIMKGIENNTKNIDAIVQNLALTKINSYRIYQTLNSTNDLIKHIDNLTRSINELVKIESNASR